MESQAAGERNAFGGRLTNNTSTRPIDTHNFIIFDAKDRIVAMHNYIFRTF